MFCECGLCCIQVFIFLEKTTLICLFGYHAVNIYKICYTNVYLSFFINIDGLLLYLVMQLIKNENVQ